MKSMVLVGWLSLFMAGVAFGSDGMAPAYAAGMDAAKRGDDTAALHAFDTAARAGMDTPRLHYNRGIVLYRLGRTDEAESAFRRAVANPALASLTHYHLGCIARDRKDWAEARKQFQRAAAAAGTAELRTLAKTAATALPPPAASLLLLSVSAGFDSAAGFRDEDIASDSRKGDFFGNLWLHAERTLLGDEHGGMRLFGGLAAILHARETEANLMLLEAGAGVRHPFEIWETDAGLQAQHIRVDGDSLENMAEFFAEGRRLLRTDEMASQTRIRLRGRLGFVKGGGDYEHLDGIRSDTRIRFAGAWGGGRWLADTLLEIHDRADQETETSFSSASPVRLQFGAGYRRRLSETLDAHVNASWRWSRFRGRDTLADGETRGRRDERLALSGVATYRTDVWPWRPFARMDWTDNASNIPIHAYDRFRLSFGAERSW